MTLRVYLDLDGVIVDFLKKAVEVCKLPLDYTKIDKWSFWSGFMSDNEFWDAISKYDKFWEQLELYSYSQQLVSMLYTIKDIQLFFCTSPGPDYHSASGKIKFLRNNDFLQHNNFVITQHKYLLANRYSLLIDDGYHNFAAFTNHGGLALLWPHVCNANYKHSINQQLSDAIINNDTPTILQIVRDTIEKHKKTVT